MGLAIAVRLAPHLISFTRSCSGMSGYCKVGCLFGIQMQQYSALSIDAVEVAAKMIVALVAAVWGV